jgi:CubicO group peptidase (beta-lactamase class C family)
MKTYARSLGCLVIVVCPALTWGQQKGTDESLSRRAREALRPFVESKEISGAVALVGDKDGALVLEPIGQANAEQGRPMRPDTLFRIASMTKPITAIGIMMLVEEGKLALDSPVETYLPEFKGQMLISSKEGDKITLVKPARLITLRDLLTHTSGLPGGPPQGLGDLYTKRDHTLAEAVMAFSQSPLEYPPGSKWAYCNAGIDTLGRLIEVASGQSYESFLKDRLFAPLGMNDTVFYPSDEQLQRTAVTYNKGEGGLSPVTSSIIGPPKGAKYPIPAGGLYSAAPDLARLYRMMLQRGSLEGRRYLSESSVAEMTKQQTPDIKTGFVDGMGWGLGYAYVREPQGVTEDLSAGSYGHGGAFGTQAWIDPVKGKYVVLLIQRAGLPNSDASDMRKALQKAALGKE